MKRRLQAHIAERTPEESGKWEPEQTLENMPTGALQSLQDGMKTGLCMS
jgi:hypothetical protein